MSLKITPTDDEKEKEGTWTNYLGIPLKIARSNQPKYIAEVARRMKIFRNNGKMKNNMPLDEMTTESCKAIANHILLDWKKTPKFDFDYSREKAFKLLKNDPDCRDFVIEFADDAANFYSEETEEIAGKS